MSKESKELSQHYYLPCDSRSRGAFYLWVPVGADADTKHNVALVSCLTVGETKKYGGCLSQGAPDKSLGVLVSHGSSANLQLTNISAKDNKARP